MRRLFILLAIAALAALPIRSGAAYAASTHSGAAQKKIGGATVSISGPGAGHRWVNKSADVGIMLAPKRYDRMFGHILAIYARGSFNAPTKAYNNHCAVFYVGPVDRVWSMRDFAELKGHLMPVDSPPDDDKIAAEGEYLLNLLREGVGFDAPKRKAKKYYERLQKSQVLRDNPDSVVLTLRHKKKGEKDKQITMSLALVRGKLLGTVYYQVAPGKKERQRAAELTMKWQDDLLAANSLRAES